MTAGALAGVALAVGVLLIIRALRDRRPGLIERITPYVRERPTTSGLLVAAVPDGAGHHLSGVAGDLLLAGAERAAGLLESLGSSAQSVRRRLAWSASRLTITEFRLQQLVWAGTALGTALALGLTLALVRPVNVVALGVLALLAALSGAAGRDWWLSRCVERRRERIEAQLPDVVELLALSVGAGQGPVAAIERVVTLGRGDLVTELAHTLTDVRSGAVLTSALDRMSTRVNSPGVSRFCEAMAVSLERGTPLAEVMRAQATDSREATRRRLMEEGGRREIAQMVPVVFLVLPVTVVFALFPGLFVLRLGL